MVAFLRSDYLLCMCVGGELMQHVHLRSSLELADHYMYNVVHVHVHVFLRFQQILLYYMEHNEYELVMETCKRHG